MEVRTPVKIGFVLFPDLTQLDLTGPFETLAMMPGAEMYLVSKTLDPVTSHAGLSIVPTTTYDTCPRLDILCVPGGPGTVGAMQDRALLDFLRDQAAGAQYVTSVCTGSIVLGAAGLLKGYRAGCHWSFRDQLPLFGAIPDDGRVVFDRNRITGGGITAGIDFGLSIIRHLRGDDAARTVQLVLEYNPEPPFDSGSPAAAGPQLTETVRALSRDYYDASLAAAKKAQAAGVS